MATLPLAWLVSALTAIAAATLATNVRLPREARAWLCLFLCSLTVIGLLLGLRLEYGAAWAPLVQPVVAAMLAPSAWAGFRALAQDAQGQAKRRVAVTAGVIIAVQALVLLAPPPVFELALTGITAVYLVRLLMLLRLSPDEFAHVPAGGLPLLRGAMAVVAVLLAMSVVTDLGLLAAGTLGGDAQVLRWLTGATGLFTGFVFVVALVGTPLLLRPVEAAGTAEQSKQPETEADRDVLAELDRLMNGHQLVRDSNLTLARVARRLGRPAREVSVAANRCTGESFTRYVNGHRIAHAQRLLRESELPVTEVMLESGFASKSSFNTEFRRVTGQTPTQFRAG